MLHDISGLGFECSKTTSCLQCNQLLNGMLKNVKFLL